VTLSDDVIAACLSGVVRRVVIDSAGVVVDAGRKRRLFTGVARELALLLWQHCGHLGCNVPADQCQVDHIAEWEADDGPTDQSNAHPRCDTHNPFKSRHRLRSVRDRDGCIVDHRADGTPMLPVGRRPPDEQSLVDAVLHGLWCRLIADRSAARSWDQRVHRTSAGRLDIRRIRSGCRGGLAPSR
jgi:hypothetical protein